MFRAAGGVFHKSQTILTSATAIKGDITHAIYYRIFYINVSESQRGLLFATIFMKLLIIKMVAVIGCHSVRMGIFSSIYGC